LGHWKSIATFTAPSNISADTSLLLKLTIIDSNNATTTDDVDVDVLVKYTPTSNRSPIANSGQNQTADTGDTVTLDGTGSSDADDTFSSYSWIQTFIRKWGSPRPGSGQLTLPIGVAVDCAGNVYVTDQNDYDIQKYDSVGNFITKWGSEGTGDGQCSGPRGVAVDSSGNVYVADRDNYRIQHKPVATPSPPATPAVPTVNWTLATPAEPAAGMPAMPAEPAAEQPSTSNEDNQDDGDKEG